MSEAMLFQRGGVGGKLWAAIQVSYPEGSVCTCSDGVKTLKATDTSGKFVFAVPYAADWTISANGKTAVVSITTDGQLESVTISSQLVLYDSGNLYTDVTGGWEKYSKATLTKAASYLRVVPSTQYSEGYAGSTNAIDLTNASTLYFTAKNNAAQSGYLVVGVSATKGGSFKAKASYSASQDTTKSVNVSSLSGLYYVQFEVYWGDTVKGDGRITKVWGE